MELHKPMEEGQTKTLHLAGVVASGFGDFYGFRLWGVLGSRFQKAWQGSGFRDVRFDSLWLSDLGSHGV